MSASLQRLLSAVSSALSDEDGATAAMLLSHDAPPHSRVEQMANDILSPSFGPTAARALRGPFASVAINHLLSCAHDSAAAAAAASSSERPQTQQSTAAVAASASAALESAHASLTALRTAVRSEPRTVWHLPLLSLALLRLRRAATAADAASTAAASAAGQHQAQGQRQAAAAGAVDVAMGWYRQVLSDREEWSCSLKQAKLTVINTLFKLFYSLGNIRRCADLIRDAEKQPLDLSLFPRAQAVTYQYYLGRTYLFDDRYHDAEVRLSYALDHCHRSAHGNITRVLTVLVPLRLQLNRPVSGAALRQRGLRQLADLAEAVAEGHVAKYHACATEHMLYFIETGVYLLVERLLMNVYRNLFRRVHRGYIQLTSAPERAHVLPLDVLHASLRVVGGGMDADHLECVLANLIHTKAMRGYIAQGKAVVLSKKGDPFP